MPIILNSLANTARLLDLVCDDLAEVFEMDVPVHELGEGISDGEIGLPKSASVISVTRQRACAATTLWPWVVTREQYRRITRVAGVCDMISGPSPNCELLTTA
jgi:hypothetical protein